MNKCFKKWIILVYEYLQGFILYIKDYKLFYSVHKLLLNLINKSLNPKNYIY